jgi:hypothetical protein
MATTGESIWTRAYVKRLNPKEAAELVQREYESKHRPSWVKRKR